MNPNTDDLTGPIPFALPEIGSEEIDAVTQVLKSGWLTTGAQALAFEREFSEAVGSTYALAVSSATAGLHLALEAVGVGHGSHVITTPYTFAATAEVIRYLGAEVQFVDILPDAPLIDPEAVAIRLEELLKTGASVGAIVPVHYGGQVCDMNALREIGVRYGVPIIEDAAHSFPSRTENGLAGTLGTVGVFSFYATKPITTGEGGMVCTDDRRIAERIKTMRLHGIDREAWNRYHGTDAGWYYQVVEAGFKYNMSDISASIGRVQLKKAWAMRDRRSEIASYYLESFEDLDFLTLPTWTTDHAWHLFPVQINAEKSGCDRDEAIRRLNAAGIGTSVHYTPLHMMPYYKKRYGFTDGMFPNSCRRFTNTISLPLYSQMSKDQCRRVVAAVRAIPENT